MGHIITEEELDRIIAEHDKLSGAFKSAMGGDNCWDAGIEVVKKCDVLSHNKFSIVFSVLVDEKIKRLMKVFPHLEWLGYLVGEVDRVHNNVYIEDIIIPRQRVSSGAVTNVEYEWNEGLPIIGVIHSHHGMGAFFSGTDDTYINQNHDVSIVVATRTGAEIKAQVRMKTDCGKYYICEKVTYHVNGPFILDVGAFMELINTNIQKPAFTNNYPLGGTNTYYRNGYRVVDGRKNFGAGNINANIASRMGFKPFITEDLELELDELNGTDDGEDEWENTILDDDEFDETDQEEKETWAEMVARQRDLLDQNEKVTIIERDAEYPVVTIKEKEPLYGCWTDVEHGGFRSKSGVSFEEIDRKRKFGWLVGNS